MYDNNEEWCNIEGKLICAFQNDLRNLANFHRLKNIDFILEIKMVEPNQNKSLKQLGRPDAVRKLYFTLEINEMNSTINNTFYTRSTESLFLGCKKISKTL